MFRKNRHLIKSTIVNLDMRFLICDNVVLFINYMGVLMSGLSKKQRKIVRELVRTAYTRELAFNLEKLAQQFDEWRNHQINGFELTELIHQYHDGISRDLFKIYNYSKDEVYLLARAVHFGFLNNEEIPTDFVKKITALRKYLNAN